MLSEEQRAAVRKIAEQLDMPNLAEIPEAGGHYGQWEDREWQDRVWKAGVDAGLFNDGIGG